VEGLTAVHQEGMPLVLAATLEARPRLAWPQLSGPDVREPVLNPVRTLTAWLMAIQLE
jgi:hypothetical protein